MSAPLLELRHLQVAYEQGGAMRRQRLSAVRDVSLTLHRGEALGLVGESGCGKTTLGRALLQLGPQWEGDIRWEGRSLAGCPPAERQQIRSQMGLVFQDPLGAFNPRKTVLVSVADALRRQEPSRQQRLLRAREMLQATGLTAAEWEQYPHALSGGQRQRAAIARAMVGRPKLLVCDEPVSALDGGTRDQIMSLLLRLQREREMAILFISHDLRAVEVVCDRIAVMYLGEIVELGNREDVFQRPCHPYTKALLDSILPLTPHAPAPAPLKGELPDPLHPPEGCPFHTRCPRAQAECRRGKPELHRLEKDHWTACRLE